MIMPCTVLSVVPLVVHLVKLFVKMIQCDLGLDEILGCSVKVVVVEGNQFETNRVQNFINADDQLYCNLGPGLHLCTLRA